ncbi:MAG: magnesium transporter [Dehalococcoidia bacterium]|nr:magnesium transporter [Dehalococcoidia bacterium]
MATDVKAKEPGIETVQWNGLTWVNVERPTRAEMSFLRERYGFHPLALEDCISRIQLPKIDEYGEYVFLVLHFPLFNPTIRMTEPSQVSIFAASSYVVTVHQGDLRPLSKLFQDCSLSEAVRNDVMGRSSGYLLYRILDVLVDACFPILNQAIENLERIEREPISKNSSYTIRELSIIRRDVVAYRRLIRPQVEVMETLEAREYPLLKVDPDVYFGDLADHTRRIWEELEELKEVGDGLSDTFLASNIFTTNDALRALTIVFTMTLPGTLLATLYGMNVPLPFQNHSGTLWVMLGLSIIPSAALLIWLRRRGWF